MPYKIVKHGKKYSVVNSKSGRVHSYGTTKEKAKSQLRLLYGVEHGWKPTGRKSRGKSSRKKIRKSKSKSKSKRKSKSRKIKIGPQGGKYYLRKNKNGRVYKKYV